MKVRVASTVLTEIRGDFGRCIGRGGGHRGRELGAWEFVSGGARVIDTFWPVFARAPCSSRSSTWVMSARLSVGASG
jgi:hypothetical protein